MLTIFSTPKDFIGHFDIIQTNAINSWRALSNDIEIIIFGNSIGTKEAADSINAIHIVNVPVSDNGLPTIPGLFKSAESNGSSNVFCFLNSDIILSPNFLTSIQHIYLKMKKFLAVGYRYNIDVNSIAPGYFESDMTSDISNNQLKKITKRTPLKRLANINDIVNAIDFFASSKSSFINGQVIAVDGGLTC